MHIFQDKNKKLFVNRYSTWYLNVKNSFTVVAHIYKSPSAAFWSSEGRGNSKSPDAT